MSVREVGQESGGERGQDVGEWGPVVAFANAAIHATLLPTGKVLFWGRRDSPQGTLDDHFCTPHVWDPVTGATEPTPQPKRADGTTVNLFCSGHAVLPDGRVLVAGGHFKDSLGIDQASVYDHAANTWTPLPVMNDGRWYPTALALANGHVLVLSGSFAPNNIGTPRSNNIPQTWDGQQWRTLASLPTPLPLFPCLHVAPDGRVFMSGPAAQGWFLDTAGIGEWTPLAGPGGARRNALRDYAPSIMYEPGKILYIGGGNNPPPDDIPTAAVELIDLTAPQPAWRAGDPMHFPRRQHNATLLPDGTVLVTGGSRGAGFNGLDPGGPVHAAELWNPATEKWTIVAAESVDRCYHSTAILLPDATVLSAGGGEFDIGNHTPNPPRNTHRDAQIYRPAYLFRGDRPAITSAPTAISYGEGFALATTAPDQIGRVTLLRLASVTHTNNMNQRINALDFTVEGGGLRVTSPARPELCPPGHYMLFVLNHAGVPSVANIVHVGGEPAATAAKAQPPAAMAANAQPAAAMAAKAQPAAAVAPAATLEELDRAIRAGATGTKVALGLTSKCPYGLAGCWRGAYDALLTLDGVTDVPPIANGTDSTADVFLGTDTLPDPDRWAEQIALSANGSYDLRGIEVSITGVLGFRDSGLVLTGPSLAAPLPLRPLGANDKIQFDRSAGLAHPATEEETTALDRLAGQAGAATAAKPVRVTGPLARDDDTWVLRVRAFEEA
jgi:hypothetical protein